MLKVNAVDVFDLLCVHAAKTSNSGMRYADIKKALAVPAEETMKLRNALRKLRDKGLICNGERGWQLDEDGLNSETFLAIYEELMEHEPYDPSW